MSNIPNQSNVKVDVLENPNESRPAYGLSIIQKVLIATIAILAVIAVIFIRQLFGL